MLRLVHPADHGQDPPKRKGRRAPALSLTAEETRHLRVATRNAVRAYGSASVLAEVIGVPMTTIHRATGEKGRRLSGSFAIRLAKATGMTVEAVLGPVLTAAGRCQACGARLAEGRCAAGGAR